MFDAELVNVRVKILMPVLEADFVLLKVFIDDLLILFVCDKVGAKPDGVLLIVLETLTVTIFVLLGVFIVEWLRVGEMVLDIVLPKFVFVILGDDEWVFVGKRLAVIDGRVDALIVCVG